MPTRKAHSLCHGQTGRAFAARGIARLAPQAGFRYTIDVLPITVAALMTTDWVASRINVPKEAEQVILPGYCGGDLVADSPEDARPHGGAWPS